MGLKKAYDELEITDGPLELNQNDITNVGAIDSESVNTEQVTNGPIYAGNFDGEDADARLDAALSEVSKGEVVWAEQATYDNDRTISTSGIDIISNDSAISGEWTLSDFSISLNKFKLNSDVNFDQILCSLKECQFGTDISTDQDNTRIYNCDFSQNEFLFGSGTSGGVAVGNVRSSITDNGSNTVPPDN